MAPRYQDDDDEDAAGVRASEYPDARDMDDDDDDAFIETIDCPHCGKAVYAQAERCPACGKYLSDEDAPQPRSRWLVIGVVLCLAIIVLTMVW